ncbi:MAG TPA: hypothetical protein VMH39_15655, partial [Gemmatimonadaceae bacterium]|nr:hypothetical protein [Gemmatimonadaceae bacterium]
PNVSLVSPSLRPQQTVRSNLSWNSSILDARLSTTIEGTYSINLHQQRTVDLNFEPTVRFALPDEAGRPVYVQTASIVAGTGAIASGDARVSQAFSHVSEVRSDLQSRTEQLSVSLRPIPRAPSAFTWTGTYTYSHIREEYSGFSSTAGDPTAIAWGTASQGPHQLSYGFTYAMLNTVRLSWNGSFRSGNAFTPQVAGDINGDGYANDRAFVFDPAHTADTAVAAAMRQLLQGTTAGARECLLKQLGRIADRNSCRAPWSTTGNVAFTLDRVKFHMPQRATIQFSLSNPIGAADLVVNGSGHLKGWGQSQFPDPTLLYVRGFDPVNQRFLYLVNARFGAPRQQVLTLSQPVTLTASVKVDLGPTREQQYMLQYLGYGRTTPGNKYPDVLFRSLGSSSILNPMVTILRQEDSLRLTSLQADSIASMNRDYNYRVDSLWTPVTRYLAALPNTFDKAEAYDRFLTARHAQIDLMARIGPLLDQLLTDEQRRKLPAAVTNVLDPRYLDSIRNGTGTYVGPGS